MHIAQNATFYTQRNNNIRPWSQCGVTSIVNALSLLDEAGKWVATALLDELKKRASQPEDALAKELNSKYAWNKLQEIAPGVNYSPWNDSRVLTATVNELSRNLGVVENRDIVVRKNISMNDIRGFLGREIPVIMGGLFTSSGHFVCFAGYKDSDFIVRDSWGNYRTAYKSHEGKDLLYNKADIKETIFHSGDSAPAMIVSL